MIYFDIRHYECIGSTNDEALRLAGEGVSHGTVVCAREQLTGRGRRGRQWHSPAGNLYASVLLRPAAPAGLTPQLGFVAALAVADTVDRFLPDGVRAELKWPNDVLVGGAKIAGILIEAADAVVVIGIGLNILHAPTNVPYPVTSLAASGVLTVNANAVLKVLLGAFDRWLPVWEADGFGTVRTAWLARAHAPGSLLRVTSSGRTSSGRFVDLGEDGTLIIETATGPARIVSGDVSRCGSAMCAGAGDRSLGPC